VIVDNTFHRAVHKIRLQALAHNYSEVESAANRQRCSVIVVVKADGYGHGAIPTAIYLADTIGADAFAVATLEEGIALRKALQQTAEASPPGNIPLLNRLGNVQMGHHSQQHPPPHHSSSTGGIHYSQGGMTKEQDFGGASIGGADNASLMYGPSGAPTANGRGGVGGRLRSMRQGHVRILVLGPPVGFPRCFDDYYHHNIEVMISGPEVAKALLEWVVNKNERMRKQVERAAAEAKELILSDQHLHTANGNGAGVVAPAAAAVTKPRFLETMDSNISAGDGSTGGADNTSTASSTRSGQSSSGGGAGQQQQYHPPSATLSNVTGHDLAKEVREILRNQKLAAESQQLQQRSQPPSRKASGGVVASGGETTVSTAPSSTVVSASSSQELLVNGKDTSVTCTTTTTTATLASTSSSANLPASTTTSGTGVRVFAGIEEAAKYSRTRQKAIASGVFYECGEDEDENDSGDAKSTNNQQTSRNGGAPSRPSDEAGDSVGAVNSNAPTKSRIPTNTNRNALPLMGPPKKRLRWHALVDSGMGRLGFRTDPVSKEEQGKRRDSVEILKELVDLEVTLDCPIEFYGMCTHMADANSNSTYTHSQIAKFKNLLKRVRAAGISVPTISTDNSAALLTTNLTHFDAKELLTQADADSRGFVRTGGAVYGQRPAFTQLRAVSTLMASVRHVAILKEGESVGYDRAYVARRSVRIATLTIGFADGYPRELGNGVGKVSIRGHLFPVAGNVCMDMVMVELGSAGDKHGIGAQVVVGDTAILWGPDDGEEGEGHVRLQDLAATLKTTQSALTCGLNKERVLRQYS